MRRPIVKFSAVHHDAIAKTIREIMDPEDRRKVCEIVGHRLNQRWPGEFDWYQWRKRCMAER
jgi:hypothetical protein